MNWISINDRLPEKFERVLCYNLDCVLMCYGVCIYNGSRFLFDVTLMNNHSLFDKIADKPTKVTHWISLPKAP